MNIALVGALISMDLKVSFQMLKTLEGLVAVFALVGLANSSTVDGARRGCACRPMCRFPLAKSGATGKGQCKGSSLMLGDGVVVVWVMRLQRKFTRGRRQWLVHRVEL